MAGYFSVEIDRRVHLEGFFWGGDLMARMMVNLPLES